MGQTAGKVWSSPESGRKKALQHLAKSYCLNNVQQLQWSVAAELKAEARIMLCEYWGEDAVKRTEAYIEKRQSH